MVYLEENPDIECLDAAYSYLFYICNQQLRER